MQRCMTANGAHHLHARALAVGTLHIDDFIALAHAEIDGLLDQLVQLAHAGQCGFAHAQAGLDQIAQFQKAHAQAVAAGFRAVYEAACSQIIEDAVGGGGVQTRLLADFLERHGFFTGGQNVDQDKHAL